MQNSGKKRLNEPLAGGQRPGCGRTRYEGNDQAPCKFASRQDFNKESRDGRPVSWSSSTCGKLYASLDGVQLLPPNRRVSDDRKLEISYDMPGSNP